MPRSWAIWATVTKFTTWSLIFGKRALERRHRQGLGVVLGEVAAAMTSMPLSGLVEGLRHRRAEGLGGRQIAVDRRIDAQLDVDRVDDLPAGEEGVELVGDVDRHLDLRRVTERVSVQFRSEFFNAFNRVNFKMPNDSTGQNHATRLNSAIFGAANGAFEPRQIQFALKVIW